MDKIRILTLLFAFAVGGASVVGSAEAGDAPSRQGSSASPLRGTLPLGTLQHDGPATPEQLSLFLPLTGALPQSAVASVRYKPENSSTWIVGHPLYRLNTTYSGGVDAFAWPIIDLMPDTTYNVEVAVTSGAITETKAGSFTTRALPPPAGPANKIIDVGSSQATIQAALDGLNPGDVLEFKNGTYRVKSLVLRRRGTTAKPIYIRGASRGGVALAASSGQIFEIQKASDIILENMTLQGSGTDSGTAVSSIGVRFWDGAAPTQKRITVRNLTMKGIDSAISTSADISEVLVYNNTFIGNDAWISSLFDTNATWNDDGINVGGTGNAVFNNTLKGFGDSLSFAAHSGGDALTTTIGVHFYRNDVRNSGDDLTEVDYAKRNVTFYDNRSHNSMTFISLDPLRGGPFVAARNIAINVGRTPYKWNSGNAGQFIYNNTVIRTANAHPSRDISGWYQPNNGPQVAYGFQNNIFIYLGAGKRTLWIESGGHNPVDWTNNSWYPDRGFTLGGGGGNLGAVQAATLLRMPARTPIFSNATRMFRDDNITTANPWTETIPLGPSYYTEVTGTYTPTLAPATSPKNSGTVIPNITDGYSGSAPDRGAIISGRVIPLYGDPANASRVPRAPTRPD